jgi:hypothetical protein
MTDPNAMPSSKSLSSSEEEEEEDTSIPVLASSKTNANTPPTTTATATSSLSTQICGLFMPLEAGMDHDKKKVLDVSEHMSPFVKYEDGYYWPDLYSEIDEMLVRKSTAGSC